MGGGGSPAERDSGGRGGEVIRTMFDKATLSLGTISVISKVALMAGSSQQGKALRASVAWGGWGHTHH